MKYLAAPDDLSDDHVAFNCAYKCPGGCAHLTCSNLAGRVKCTFIFCPFKALVYKWWGTVSSPDISTVSGSTDFSYSHLCFCFILDATHLSFEPVSYLCCFLCIKYDPQNNCYREVLLKDQYSQQQRFCQLSEYLRIPLHRTLLIFPLLEPSWHFPTLSLGPDVRPPMWQLLPAPPSHLGTFLPTKSSFLYISRGWPHLSFTSSLRVLCKYKPPSEELGLNDTLRMSC